jgi:hypothetical protein
MLMPEEFERCEQCGEGWFEKRERVLIRKDSPRDRKPDIYKKEILYVCANRGCRYIQYRYVDTEE